MIIFYFLVFFFGISIVNYFMMIYNKKKEIPAEFTLNPLTMLSAKKYLNKIGIIFWYSQMLLITIYICIVIILTLLNILDVPYIKYF